MATAMKPPKKRLFICCDGTGNDAIRNKNDMITNVARFARCLKQYGQDGILQLVYYHEGIGTKDGKKQYFDSAGGQSIHGDIQDAYHFLCLNYSPGDEIHLIGFSRGAFTVRSLACFIEDFGILRVTRLATLTGSYNLWKDQKTDKLNGHRDTWAEKGHLVINPRIETCAVWDTVSSMHLPASTLDFVEKRVSSDLINAFQALALHETRLQFQPVLWETQPSGKTNIRQTWFCGDHSDIGGGHLDSGLATISLLWMIAQFKEFTNAAFAEVMVWDCMTPLYLRWEEETFWNKEEYYLQDHIYTLGKIHGAESWNHIPYPSNSKARNNSLSATKLADVEPPKPLNRAKIPKKDLDISVFNQDGIDAKNMSISDEGYASEVGSKEVNETQRKICPTIHHTVRLLKNKRGYDCPLLDDLMTKRKGDLVAWVYAKDFDKLGIWEDRTTEWESWMYRQWIKREEDVFGRMEEDQTSAKLSKEQRFTQFLAKYRNERIQDAGPRRVSSAEQLRKEEGSIDQLSTVMDQRSGDGSIPSTIVFRSSNIFKTFSGDSNGLSANSIIAHPILDLGMEGSAPSALGLVDSRRVFGERRPPEWVERQMPQDAPKRGTREYRIKEAKWEKRPGR